jgi:hypothetical protein
MALNSRFHCLTLACGMAAPVQLNPLGPVISFLVQISVIHDILLFVTYLSIMDINMPTSFI